MTRLKFLLLTFFLAFNASPIFAQMDESILTPEFLEGLPPSVRDQIAGKNKANLEPTLNSFKIALTMAESKLNDQN